MKTKLLHLLLLVAMSVIGQEGNKIHFGLYYSLTADEDFHSNPITASIDYPIKQWDIIEFKLGLKALFFNSNVNKNFSDRWGFNPNISGCYEISSNIRGYLGIGYYFDSFKATNLRLNFEEEEISRSFKRNGLMISPGIRCFIKDYIFLDTHLNILNASVKSSNIPNKNEFNLFWNVGVGVAF